MGHDDQLVIGRHALFLQIEGAARMADDVHLVQLEIAEGADHSIDLPGNQGRRERPVDVHLLDIVHREPVRLEHAFEQGVFQPRHGKADPLALEVGNRADRAVLQHHNGVERRRDQGGDARQRQAGGRLHVQLRLVGDREVRLSGSDQLGRVVGVRRRHELDRQPRIGKVAALLGDIERSVVGVYEPVEQDGEFLFRRRREGDEKTGGSDCRETEHHGAFGSFAGS